MNIRHRGGYPPYYFTVKITTSHPEEQVAAKNLSDRQSIKTSIRNEQPSVRSGTLAPFYV